MPPNPMAARLWDNIPSTFTTANSDNTLGDSHYTVLRTSVVRLARVNLDPNRGANARNQVANIHNNRHMCFVDDATESAFWDAFEAPARVSVHPGNGAVRHVHFHDKPDAQPNYTVHLAPYVGGNVIDFDLNPATNEMAHFHAGHPVNQTPAPSRRALTTDDL